MIIKRSFLFITIALLLLFPWHVCGAAPKSVGHKKKTSVSKKVTPKAHSSKIRARKKSTSSLRAQKRRYQHRVRTRHHKKVAQDNPVKPENAPPLLKITPLENGKFLLEPTESSLEGNQGTESLSLIKKPVFNDEEKEEITKTEEEEKEAVNTFSHLLVRISKQLLGKAYRFGGTGQGNQGIDCSGFMKKIFQTLTLSLPHSSREQARLGSLVTTEWDLSRLKIGDLLFFKRRRGNQIGHTGMYIGEGKMIHSASKKGVIISNLKGSTYYNGHFVMAKRLFIFDNPQVDEFKEFKDKKEISEPSPALSNLP
jgi:cell wall-associated NlpC family hydrolase